MRQLSIPTLLVGSCIAFSASAATLQDIKGHVAINRGEGFLPVTDAIEAGVGDLVRAGKGGSANLLYSEGCVVKVKAGSLVRVSAKAPCKATYYLGEQSDSGFISQLGPFALGGAAAFTAFCISTCDNNATGNNRSDKSASP